MKSLAPRSFSTTLARNQIQQRYLSLPRKSFQNHILASSLSEGNSHPRDSVCILKFDGIGVAVKARTYLPVAS